MRNAKFLPVIKGKNILPLIISGINGTKKTPPRASQRSTRLLMCMRVSYHATRGLQPPPV